MAIINTNNQIYPEYKENFTTGNYPLAKLQLEEILAGVSEIDVNNYGMITDYAMCLAEFRDFEESLRLARKVQLILTSCPTDANCNDSLKNSWEKICKIYAKCSSSKDLMSAVIGMQGKVGCVVSNSFFIEIAQICSNANLPNEALMFCRFAESGDGLNDDSKETIKKIRTDCSSTTSAKSSEGKSKGIWQKYANYKSRGNSLSPGLVIQVSHDKLDEMQKKKIPRNWAKRKFFMIWKVTDNSVYAFPISRFKENKNPNQPRIELLTVQGENCLYLDLYEIPLSPDVIPTIIEEITMDYFKQLTRVTYNEFAHATKKEQLPEDSLGRQFLEEEKPKHAQVGSRLIIEEEYYYVCAIDDNREEYIVIPVTYHHEIRIKQYFRIPFKQKDIKAIVDTKETNRDKIDKKLPEPNPKYINRFAVYSGIPYFVVEKCGDDYVCYDMRDMGSSERLESVLLPQAVIDTCECCTGETLDNFFKAYGVRAEKVKVKRHKEAKNESPTPPST